MKKPKRLWRILASLSLFFGIALLIACTAPETPAPDLKAQIDAFAQTVTARAGEKGALQGVAGTSQAKSTETKQAIEATQKVEATVDEAAVKATM